MEEMSGQLGMASVLNGDENPEYAAFVDKFKPKKTTDDCYTPKLVYDAVLNWAAENYGFSPEAAVRPFWPGGDYTAFHYPEGCVVVDNPPFSILGQIQSFYQARAIPFFLFAPTLTCITPEKGVCAVITNSDIEYANGAKVNTSFRTNLEPETVCRTEPELARRVDAAIAAGKPAAPELPKYRYPDHVVSIASMMRLATAGIPYALPRNACSFIRRLDSQAPAGKSIFGGGFLLSDAATAAAAAAAAAAVPAVEWPLSGRERAMIDYIGQRAAKHRRENPGKEA